MENRSETALVALRRILRATEINARKLAREAGLTPSQLVILQLLDRMGEATPGAVAREASITQATVTALMDKLESQGFILRRKDDTDRRRVLVAVTEKGRVALAGAPNVLPERFQARFAALAPWEQSMIIAAFERVAALLDVENIEVPPILDVGTLDEPVKGGQ